MTPLLLTRMYRTYSAKFILIGDAEVIASSRLIFQIL
jgi:hypothetical protein